MQEMCTNELSTHAEFQVSYFITLWVCLVPGMTISLYKKKNSFY
jgi:hypothetical protein